MSKLPDSISVLDLLPHAAPSQTRLSDFWRYPDLQDLSLGISVLDSDMYDSHEEDECSKFANAVKYDGWTAEYMFETFDVLLDGRCDVLRSLSMQEPFCFKADPDVCLASYLPMLRYLNAIVKGDQQGMCLADQMVALPSLHTLDLEILGGDLWTWTMEVSEASVIQQFCLKGPRYRKPKLYVELNKPGIGFEGSRVQRVIVAPFQR